MDSTDRTESSPVFGRAGMAREGSEVRGKKCVYNVFEAAGVRPKFEPQYILQKLMMLVKLKLFFIFNTKSSCVNHNVDCDVRTE